MNKKQISLLKLCFSVAFFVASLTISADNTASTVMSTQQANDKQVSGTVLDEAGEPVIGATVTVKGTNLATVTDINGNFSFKVPAGSTLVVSYVGYSPKEVAATGTGLKVQLSQDEEVLNEVVVTALGIKKEAKALSYNVQQLNSSDVTTVKDANFMNSLAGKVAGVEINSSSAGVGGGVKVVMRGAKSLSHDNNALYVIDGIPLPSLTSAQPNDYFSGAGQSGDGASMINADDIESISVLSGAAASALYGMDAANGVIMITTKKGLVGKPRLTYSNNTSFYTPFQYPEFQNTYGTSTTGSMFSWGAKLAEASNYDPMDFFRTGLNEANSLTFSVGSEKNQTFVSAAYNDAQGIVENNGVKRYNLAIRNSTDFLDDKLHLDLSAMYSNTRAEHDLFRPVLQSNCSCISLPDRRGYP